MNRNRRGAFAGVLLALAGCSQEEPPAAGTDYFPLRDGATYEYLHSNGNWTEEVSLSETGAGEYSLRSSADPMGISAESTLVRRGADVLRTSEDTFVDGVLDQTVDYDPGFLRFTDDWLESEAGQSETRTYQRVETKAGAAAKPAVMRSHVYTVEALSERVTVPAGAFQECVRIHRSRDLEAPDPTAMALQMEQEKRYWFCPGVGKVREENVLTGSTEVLMVYDVPAS
jgi:hypothetical protein